METKNTPAPVKKQWQKPDFYLLDTDDVHTKSKASHNENSLHVTRSGKYGATINSHDTQLTISNYLS